MSTQKKPTRSMKYLQLAEFITGQIETGKLKINDRLPSVNELMGILAMSKETVLRGLNHLSEKGIIESVYRRGYYVRKKAPSQPYRICLILDKMNVLRDNIYHSFFEKLKKVAEIEVFFHHHNFKVFESLIKENLNNYTHFVIVTFLREDPSETINLIPPHKRIILDYDAKGLTGEYTCIYQDFESDIYESLITLQPQLEKYERLVLIAPNESYHGSAVIDGFKRFCKTRRYQNKIYHSVSEKYFKKGDAYITFSRYDQDDVSIIKLTRKNHLELGEDIGLISYNDTAVKEILEKGITVISTDFNKMGVDAAESILQGKPQRLREPAKVVLRNSL